MILNDEWLRSEDKVEIPDKINCELEEFQNQISCLSPPYLHFPSTTAMKRLLREVFRQMLGLKTSISWWTKEWEPAKKKKPSVI